MIRLLVFAAGSVFLIAISSRSLRNPGSHGFYRFFAWEFILALILLSTQVWFKDPFAWHQIISWCLLVASFIPLVLGVHLLRSQGRPEAGARPASGLFGFEKTTRLVTTGIFKYIRHPLYSSLLLLALGVFFKEPTLIGFILAGMATLFLIATAKADERECVQVFGDPYREYMKHTRMFLPYLF